MSATGPPDETLCESEPFKELEGEAERIVRHPGAEAQRLHLVAEAGESGATPFIEIGTVARGVIRFAPLILALVLGVCFAERPRG